MLENWVKVSLLLCIFGFFRELRPSEPFAVEYFITHRNLTIDEVTQYLFPMGTYSYMIQLIIIFLITDALRYKPIIVYSAVIGTALFTLLVTTDGFLGAQIAQCCYGSFMAAEVAYYTYIYAKVERSKYQMVTGHTRSAILAGRFIGSILAQFLISYNIMNYKQLNYISLGTQCFSLVWAILLPSVGVSLYFYADKNSCINDKNSDGNSSEVPVINVISKTSDKIVPTNEKSQTHDNDALAAKFSVSNAISLLNLHFRQSYSNRVVVQWSIWWALAMCGFLQVQSYIQLLWKEIYADNTNLQNGSVEAAITLLGAIGAFSAGFVNSKHFNRYDIWILAICTTIEGVLLLWAAFTTHLWSCYCAYILFGIIYHFMITIASAKVAKKLHEDSFALIFGINTLAALILQSTLTFITITKLELNVRIQYQVYAYWFFVLACAFGVIAILKTLNFRKKSFDLKA